jgi:osmotically-inducible protein OsmY
MTLATLATLTIMVTLLAGCAAAVVGGTVAVVSTLHDRRSSGTVLEDQTIEIKIRDRLHAEGGPGRGNHIKTLSHNYMVLLVGEVRNEADKKRAGEIAESFPQVRRVVNEIVVMPPISYGRRNRDGLLTAQVKTSLVGLGIKGFDAGHVNVVSVNGRVYLMGMVTEEEAHAATERARYQHGVERVVQVFEYIEASPEADQPESEQ